MSTISKQITSGDLKTHFFVYLPYGVAIKPQKWVPITPITPLFERAIDRCNTH